MYFSIPAHLYFDGLVQERHNSSVLAMELHISCSNPLIWVFILCDKFCMLPFLVCPCNKFPVVPDISLSLLSATVQNETIRPMATAQGFYPNSLTVRSVFRLLPIWFIHGQMNSDIWQSLSLRDWRWKSVVTLRWMGATFSGSGLAPTEYRQRHPVCTGYHALMIMIYNAGNLHK